MVARIVTGKKIAGIVHYNEDKVSQGEAYLLMANGFAIEASALSTSMKINRFRHLTKLNSATKTNAMHISLNFHHKDSLDVTKLSAIAREYMEGIGFGDQPYLVYQHLDVHHPHMHIVSTNIKRDGSRIDIHGIGYCLSEPARQAIEKKYRLTVAQGRTEKQQIEKVAIPEQLSYGQKATKKSLSRLVRAVREQYVYGSFEEFNAILKHFNVIAMPGAAGSRMEKNKGLLYAILNEKGQPTGVPIKASALNGRAILRHLEEDFPLKHELKKGLKQDVMEKIDQQIARGISSFDQFQKVLSKINIDLIVARSSEGRIFGVSYIDHETRIIFKGSELGKSYAAVGLMTRFGHAQKTAVHQGNNQHSALSQKAEESVIERGAVPMPDISFLLEPAQGLVLPTVDKRRKRKKRGMERGQGR